MKRNKDKKEKNILRCPACRRKLQFRSTAKGWVCKNWKCVHYWKLGKGSVFRLV